MLPRSAEVRYYLRVIHSPSAYETLIYLLYRFSQEENRYNSVVNTGQIAKLLNQIITERNYRLLDIINTQLTFSLNRNALE